jgi:predicted nucleotidyltransferase
MICGVSNEIMDRLLALFTSYSEVKRVIIFGSRARGDYKHNSDIDVAIFAEGGISGELYANIDEAVGIYKVDIIDMCTLDNEKLIRNVAEQGIEIYNSCKV